MNLGIFDPRQVSAFMLAVLLLAAGALATIAVFFVRNEFYPPVVIGKVEMQDAKAGETVHFTTDVVTSRICPFGKVDRWVVDSEARTHWVGSKALKATGWVLPVGDHRVAGSFELPRKIASGRALYTMQLQFDCNPVSYSTVNIGPIPFTVLE